MNSVRHVCPGMEKAVAAVPWPVALFPGSDGECDTTAGFGAAVLAYYEAVGRVRERGDCLCGDEAGGTVGRVVCVGGSVRRLRGTRDGVQVRLIGASDGEEVGREGIEVSVSGSSRAVPCECFEPGAGSVPVVEVGEASGYAETVVTGVSAGYRRNKRKREQKKRKKERAVGEAQVAPVGVRDVATPQQMRELAVQRAELYKLENERKIIKARREIAMEKQVEASGAQVQRVDNWIADVKNGSSRSSGSGWASQKTKSSKNSVWSKSWRSRSSVGTSGESVVSEEVHNAVLKRVTELERELAETKAISASRAAEARSNGLRADVVEREVFSLKVASKVAEVVTPEARVTDKAAEFRATKGANPLNILTPDDTDWRSDEVGKLLDAVAAGQDEYSGLPYSGGGTPYYN